MYNRHKAIAYFWKRYLKCYNMGISNEELVSRKYQRCIACMIRNITKFAAVQDYKEWYTDDKL